MQTSQNGINLLKKLEGCKLEAYLCSNGIPTIGIGHTKGVVLGQKITQEQAELFLRQDLKEAENYVNMNVKKPLNQNQFDALVCFTFNVGGNAFKNSTLLKKINEATYTQDIAFQMRRWIYDSKRNQVQGLINRREEEIKLYYK